MLSLCLSSSSPCEAQGHGIGLLKHKSVGPMIQARTAAASVTLGDGSVLIAGGIDGNFNYLSSAELYNPTTQLFTPLTSMTTARAGHTATLLSNGQVLIAGGVLCNQGNCEQLSSAEIFDPSKQRFRATGNMTTARGSHTATLLNDGTVLLAGGFNGNGQGLSSAEIYYPANGKFTATGTMVAARYVHTATLLPGGGVFIAGGRSCEGCKSNPAARIAEVYDPSRGEFFAAENLGEARTLHTATLLPDGRVLIAGGRSCAGDCEGARTLQDSDIYDPANGTYTAGSDMSVPRAGHKSVALPDGSVFIYGGVDCGGRSDCQSLSTGDLFQASSVNFTPVTGGTAGGTGLIMSLLADDQVLTAGGLEGSSVLTAADAFSFGSN